MLDIRFEYIDVGGVVCNLISQYYILTSIRKMLQRSCGRASGVRYRRWKEQRGFRDRAPAPRPTYVLDCMCKPDA